MRKSIKFSLTAAGVIVIVLSAIYFLLFLQTFAPDEILTEYSEDVNCTSIVINYPQNETIFPPEIIPPKFEWTDDNVESNYWLISINFEDCTKGMAFLSPAKEWTPSEEQWAVIKQSSIGKKTEINIWGFNHEGPDKFFSKASISISTSKDSVGAPIFYREVNLPFRDAVKDPTLIRWRFGSVSSKKQPPIVLDSLPVCGNCHSFSADGSLLGMDVDYANDKGSYGIVKTAERMTLANENIITWSDYKREDKELTFGLLSQVSPDGKYAVSTVKDRSVFVAVDNLAFSQLFFPVKGILAVYSREDETFKALPGASDKKYVQSNPEWSPDGKYIIFSRSKAITLESIRNKGGVLLTADDCREFINRDSLFKFDLYRIPFNNGKGGKPEPIKGASKNGMSNYFAKYSPDGKWIVFCKAESFMLLQKDSELYIMPAGGGEARRMRCNTNRMNSWHSWSPNSKWLVFASKVNSPYTQLFITHIDEEGNSSPAVLLSQFTASDRAANIPEFVNISPEGIKEIHEQFIDDNSYLRTAQEHMRTNDYENAEIACRKALKINSNNWEVQLEMAMIRDRQGRQNEAIQYCREAVRINSGDGNARSMLGSLLWKTGKQEEGMKHLTEGVSLDPENANSHIRLSEALLDQGKIDEARSCLTKAESLKPDHRTFRHIADIMLQHGQVDFALDRYHKAIKAEPSDYMALNNLASIIVQQGKTSEAENYYRRALKINPKLVQSLTGLAKILISNDPQNSDVEETIQLAFRACELTYNQEMEPLTLLISAYAKAGNTQEAIRVANIALSLAKSTGKIELAKILEKSIEVYKMNESGEHSLQ
ncbi:MAG: tetratricopeptide repeat protein [Ignavibacteria bacterium]|jgi:tetratricopeptide (TPR) repeat protein